jgi:hypothetical protein
MTETMDPTRTTTRKAYNPEEEWFFVAEAMDIFHDNADEPPAQFQYDKDGITRIPYTNKQWLTCTGMETPPRTGLVWLRQGIHYRAKDRLIHVMPIKYYKGFEWKIVWCMVKNTILCSKIAGVGVRLEAIKDTIFYYIKDFTDCPLNLVPRVSNAIAFSAMIIIDAWSVKKAEDIGSIQKKYATTRGATDYECRNALWKMLKSHGIGDLRTRKQQESLIDKIIGMPKFDHLSATLKQSILLRLRREKLLKPAYGKPESRVNEIKQKQAAKIPLTSAERKYRERHRELFK